MYASQSVQHVVGVLIATVCMWYCYIAFIEYLPTQSSQPGEDIIKLKACYTSGCPEEGALGRPSAVPGSVSWTGHLSAIFDLLLPMINLAESARGNVAQTVATESSGPGQAPGNLVRAGYPWWGSRPRNMYIPISWNSSGRITHPLHYHTFYGVHRDTVLADGTTSIMYILRAGRYYFYGKSSHSLLAEDTIQPGTCLLCFQSLAS